MVCAGHPFCPLLNVTLHQLQVFETGKEVCRCSLAIGSQLSAIQTVLADRMCKQCGEQSMSVTTTANYFVPTLLGEFNKRHNSTSMDIDVTNRENLFMALAANTTDLAIMGKPPDGLESEAYPFMEHPLVMLDVEGFPIMRHWYNAHRQGKRFTSIAQAFKEFVLTEAQSLLVLHTAEHAA